MNHKIISKWQLLTSIGYRSLAVQDEMAPLEMRGKVGTVTNQI